MRPYPSHLVKNLTLPDGSAITIRSIKPEDAAIEQEFVRGLSKESRYFRFMDSLRELGFHASFDPGDFRVMRVEARL